MFGTVPVSCWTRCNSPGTALVTPGSLATSATAAWGNDSSDTDKKKSWVNFVPALPSFDRSVTTLLFSLSNAVGVLRVQLPRGFATATGKEPATTSTIGRTETTTTVTGIGRGRRRSRRRSTDHTGNQDVGAHRVQRPSEDIRLGVVQTLRHADNADHEPHADRKAQRHQDRTAQRRRSSRPIYVR